MPLFLLPPYPLLPVPLLAKVHGELAKTYAQPELRKQLTEQLGMDLVVSSPDAMSKFLTAEIGRWAKVVKENGIRAD